VWDSLARHPCRPRTHGDSLILKGKGITPCLATRVPLSSSRFGSTRTNLSKSERGAKMKKTTLLLAAILALLSASTASAANWKAIPAAITHWKQIA
jgi:hypothetical protein